MGLTLAHQPCCHCPKLPPRSTKLSPFHRSFNGAQATHSHIIQTLLGHFFCGEYYAHFFPTESVSCPCGHSQQTRAHVLTDYPIYDAYRHHLRTVSRTLSLLSYSAPNPALKRSRSSSLNPMLSLRMSQAVLQTMVNLSLLLCISN